MLVTGPPGAGKTTLARRLAGSMHLPLIAKDSIKERLFDSLGWSDRDWSTQLGKAAFELMYHLIEEQLRAGASVIVEAAFWRLPSAQRIGAILARYPSQVIEIHCTCDPEVSADRCIAREAGDRHIGHAGGQILSRDQMIADRMEGRYDALSLSDEVIRHDTSEFNDAAVSAIELMLATRLSSHERE